MSIKPPLVRRTGGSTSADLLAEKNATPISHSLRLFGHPATSCQPNACLARCRMLAKKDILESTSMDYIQFITNPASDLSQPIIHLYIFSVYVSSTFHPRAFLLTGYTHESCSTKVSVMSSPENTRLFFPGAHTSPSTYARMKHFFFHCLGGSFGMAWLPECNWLGGFPCFLK